MKRVVVAVGVVTTALVLVSLGEHNASGEDAVREEVMAEPEGRVIGSTVARARWLLRPRSAAPIFPGPVTTQETERHPSEKRASTMWEDRILGSALP